MSQHIDQTDGENQQISSEITLPIHNTSNT